MLAQRPRGHYFDELRAGDSFDCGGFTVTEEAIIRFAAEWDMQPFHVDREAAAGTVFQGLVGSGLHSVMLAYRLYFQRGLLDGTVIAGLGIDAIRFHNPLRPNTTLRVEARVEDARATSRPDRGVIVWGLSGNAGGLPIIVLRLTALVHCLPAGTVGKEVRA